jgi:hypothetical protein
LGNVYVDYAFDTAYKEFIQTLTYYLGIAIPLRKMNINKQKVNGLHLESVNLVKKLKFLNRYIKENNVSTGSINYFNNYKIIYHKVINLAKRMYYEKVISASVSKSETYGT